MTPALRFAPGAVAALALTVVFAAGCTDGGQPEAAESVIDGDIGAEVYANNCASCHGANLEGTDKGPSQLSIVYEPNHHTDESYRAAIANGAPNITGTSATCPPSKASPLIKSRRSSTSYAPSKNAKASNGDRTTTRESITWPEVIPMATQAFKPSSAPP